MIHVGNDIVDFRSKGTRGRSGDKRFLDRVLTHDEKQELKHHDNPETLLWIFWAAKETAFKAMSKSSPRISSAPRRYRVNLTPDPSRSVYEGIVKTPLKPVAVKTFVEKDHVHCIGVTGSCRALVKIVHCRERIESRPGVMPTPEQESDLVRKLARDRMAVSLNINAEDIQIKRDRQDNHLGPPRVCIKGKNPGPDISLSHHGRYAACAFLMDK